MSGLLLSALLAIEPGSGWFLRNQTAARANPLGLFDELRVGHRWQLAEPATFAVSANSSVSPAFARGGLGVDLQLLSVLDLSAIYEAGAWFGTFDQLQSYPSAASPEHGGASYPAAMQQLILGASVSLHRWRFTLKSNDRLVFQQIAIRPGDRVFYDANWDILFPNGGWIFVDDTDLLFQVIPGLRLGARYNFTHAFYSSGPDVNTQRFGPLVSWLLFEKPHAAFNAPTLSLVVNWWLQHPTRAMDPIPYVGLAFTFRSDLG